MFGECCFLHSFYLKTFLLEAEISGDICVGRMVNFFFVSKIVGVSEPTPKCLNRQIIVGLVHIILVLLSDGVIRNFTC